MLATVDDAARARAVELAAAYDGFFSRFVAVRQNAPALLHLAATATDPELASAALDAISRAYAAEETDKRRAFDADYFAVVRQRLASTDPKIQTAAFVAAEAGMASKPLDAELRELLLDHATRHAAPVGRIAALRALTKMKNPTKAVEDAFHHGLDDASQAVVALTLDLLDYPFGERLPDQVRLEARLIQLLSHADPGIRGVAATTLANRTVSSKDDARIAALVQPLTSDPHWFVRLSSLEARTEVDDPTVLAPLIAGLDDTSKIEFVVPGWVGLDGAPEIELLNNVILGETWSEAAVTLLRRATRGEPHAFNPTPVDPADLPAGTRRQVDEAKAWAKANAALLRSE